MDRLGLGRLPNVLAEGLGIPLAMEQGVAARVFPDEASALLWLRHGAR